MTAAARLPDNAPFPADAIAVLNRVIAGTTAVQRSWLSGFLAGIEAANPVAAAAAPPAAKQPLTILFATESGNAEALAAKAKKDAARLGFAARVLDAAEATPSDLAGAKNLVAIVSTWGEGEPPQIELPLTLQDRRLSLARLPVLRLPELVWPVPPGRRDSEE